MVHILSDDFSSICKSILVANKTLEEWVLIESDDMFQEGNYVGGFDSIEMQFCFSLVERDLEYWFQLSLEEIKAVNDGEIRQVNVRPAEY